MRWRNTARLGLALFAVTFAVWVAFAFKKRDPAPAAPAPVTQTDPKAVVESTGGRLVRYKGTREDVSVLYEKQLTYATGATKLSGVKVTTQPHDGGRTIVITGKEGAVGDNQSTITLDGDVRLAASDGLAAATEHATYVDAEGLVRAPGPVTFSQGRLSGSGIGVTYDKNRDILTILDQAVVQQAAGDGGTGAQSFSAGAATIARRDKFIRFERGMHLARGTQTIEADNGVATLSPDEKHIQSVDLHGGARVGGGGNASGGLQALAARDMTLTYAPGGDALEHVTAIGDADIRLAGSGGKAGRQITANTLDIGLAPDGTTPTGLAAHGMVSIVLPVEGNGPTRRIAAESLNATGDAKQGLTRAQLTGSVRYREQGGGRFRGVNSEAADLVFLPQSDDIDRAEFSRSVRVDSDAMEAAAAVVRYLPNADALELSGTEPASLVPHVVNEQITVDARRIDVTLAGPRVKASGDVKSVLKPSNKASAKGETKLPSMLKQDQPVNVTANELNYDGGASRAVYTGAAQLWQGDTSVKGASITIDDKTGDLGATGPVATTALFEQENKDKAKERVRSVATAKEFTYEESARRAIYTGDVHMSGPQGDITAARVELFLKASGSELERAEAYDAVTLREQARTTTGARMTYFAADEQYVVTGTPVKVVDECGRETTGKTLKFLKSADTIVVDGNERNRTQTRGGTACK